MRLSILTLTEDRLCLNYLKTFVGVMFCVMTGTHRRAEIQGQPQRDDGEHERLEFMPGISMFVLCQKKLLMYFLALVILETHFLCAISYVVNFTLIEVDILRLRPV